MRRADPSNSVTAATKRCAAASASCAFFRENAARERPEHSPHPLVATAQVTPRSADNLPIPNVGAAPRVGTLPLAVAGSSEGEVPAAPGITDKAAAPSAQTTDAREMGVARVEMSEVPTTMALMREELAMAKMSGDSVGQETESVREKNAKGGIDDEDIYFGESEGTATAAICAFSGMNFECGVAESSRKNLCERSSLTDGIYRLKRNQKAGIGSQDGPWPGTEIPAHGNVLYGAGKMVGRGGMNGRYAILADGDVDEDALPSVGGETKDEADAGSDMDMEEYVDEEELGDEYWAVQEEATVEDLIWNRLCKNMAAAPPNLLIKELKIMRNNGTRHKGMEAVHRSRVQSQEDQNGKTRSDTTWNK